MSGQKPDMAEAVTIWQIVESLGVSERTARRYIADGTLEKIKGTRPALATKESLNRLIAERGLNGQTSDSVRPKSGHDRTVPDSGQSDNGALVEALQKHVAALEKNVDDLQRRLDESEEERRKMTTQKDQALWAALEATKMIEAAPGPVGSDDFSGRMAPTARKRGLFGRFRSN